MTKKTLHIGRLIDHVHLIARDLAASRRFYDAALGALGRKVEGEARAFSGRTSCSSAATRWRRPVRRTCISRSRRPTAPRSTASMPPRSPPAVREHGKPGERAQYHPGYYGAFVLDPDGNNIEAVHHGEADRSAASVEVTFER
jgi:catechol 2,3-dioxygenase-like lactoylglutathione lyase family enzyme